MERGGIRKWNADDADAADQRGSDKTRVRKTTLIFTLTLSDPWKSAQSAFIRVPFRIRCHSRSIPDPRCKGVPMSAEVAELLEQLRDPAAYPYPVAEVEVCQTHLSLAFL